MKKEICKVLCVCLCGFLGVWLLAFPAFAAYPEKPIQIICPYAAGGVTDMNLRIIASAALPHFGSDPFDPFSLHIHQRERRSFICKQPGSGLSDRTTRSRNDRHPVLKFHSAQPSRMRGSVSDARFKTAIVASSPTIPRAIARAD